MLSKERIAFCWCSRLSDGRLAQTVTHGCRCRGSWHLIVGRRWYVSQALRAMILGTAAERRDDWKASTSGSVSCGVTKRERAVHKPGSG